MLICLQQKLYICNIKTINGIFTEIKIYSVNFYTRKAVDMTIIVLYENANQYLKHGLKNKI